MKALQDSIVTLNERSVWPKQRQGSSAVDHRASECMISRYRRLYCTGRGFSHEVEKKLRYSLIEEVSIVRKVFEI